jgi:diguanylate cyclase (GGDEF)-like protein/PAS domain S-box-containing protein
VLAWTTHGKERAEESLRRSEERFRALVQHGSDVIIVTGLDGGVSYVSPAFERVLGHAAIDLASISSDLIHPEDLEDVRGVIEDIAQEHGALARFEARLRHADGDWRWFEVGLSNHLDDENVRGLVGNMRDITERRRFQEALHFQAYHDSLTSLHNRDAFLERLEDALRRARVERHVVGVLFLDVDRFKLVNDSLGHSVGDELLIDVAARVRDCLRPGDFVARFGGDEFTVLVDGLHDGSGAVAVAERITGAFRQPMQVSGRELFVSTSIGIAVAQNGDAEPGDLLRHADLAMYLAKDRGRSRWELFDAGSEPHVTERLELEGDLWRALESGELVVHFQPEVELDTGIVSSVEALVRWQHPRRGLLMPGDFVPVAEESSLIVAIDRYVLGVACAWARRWRDERGEPLIVGVNLSPRFMRQPDAVGAIRAMVEGSGCSPRSLRLEITERTALTDVETTVLQLHQLRALGIGVAIDDFGTGYSSLGYLKRLPVDVVKLDRTFVEGTDRHDADVAIAQAVITMGHALGMRVVAEGVERAEQALRLRAIGCDGAQGWHWSPAVNPEAVVGIASQPFPLPGGDDVESGTVLSFPASRR